MLTKTLVQELFRPAVWSLVATIAARISAIVVSILAARVLGRDGFGEFGLAQTTCVTAGVLFGAGLTVAAARSVAKLRAAESDGVRRLVFACQLVSVSGGCMGAGILVIGANPLAAVLSVPSLAPAIAWGGLLLFSSIVNAAQVGVLIGLREFKTIARLNIISAVVAVPICMAALYYKTIVAFIVFLGISQLLGAAIFQVGLFKLVKNLEGELSFPAVWQEVLGVVQFAIPATLTALIGSLVNWASFAILTKREAGLSEVALINATLPWRFLVLLGASNIAQAALPALTARTTPADRRSAGWQLLRILLTVTIPAYVLACALSSSILSLYGTQFAAGWPVFVLLLSAGVLQVMQAPLVKIMESTNQMWANFLLNVVWGAVAVGGTAALLSFGALGYAISQIAAFIVFGVAAYIMIKARRVIL